MNRTIMHIDMNAFFAAVEQQADPALRGKPVVVTGRDKRTVILTASYEARTFGIKTGMRLDQAFACCPDLIRVAANNRAYADVSAKIIDIFKDYTSDVEVFSIDEAFLDVTGSLTLFGSDEAIAQAIKAQIKKRFGLTCSVGIAENKLLAKLASGLQKPDGLTRIPPERVTTILHDLPVSALCGIGPSTAARLQGLGVTTCGQLGNYPPKVLKRIFGVMGERLILMGRGIDSRPVQPTRNDEPVKSVGHSMTLRQDLTDSAAIGKVLLQLSEMVGRRARRYGVKGRTVSLTLRYADFHTFSRRRTGTDPISHSSDIYSAAMSILSQLILEQPVRLIGISLEGLQYSSEQYPLFDDVRQRQSLTDALDQVNDRFGEFTVMSGSLLDVGEKGSGVISPAWRPDGIRNVKVR